MKTVGVLMGGPSSEHDISLMSGTNVMRALEGTFNVVPIFVSLTGEWFLGKNRVHTTPHQAVAQLDAVFNAMHGEYGEDGQVQTVLSHSRVPYTGPSAITAALAMDKVRSAELLRKAGLTVPNFFVATVASLEENIKEITRLKFAPPWMVKPARRGSSVGTHLVHTGPELKPALADALQFDEEAIIQEWIQGRELTVGVVSDMRGEEAFALPPVEIIPPKEQGYFAYSTKYDGSSTQICPADFHDAMLARIRETAVAAHNAIGAPQYSRVDMILKGTKLSVLEVNTLPGLTKVSLLPKAAAAAGVAFPELLQHIIGKTIQS
ncbi:MAG: D-alanine--D-alanine ligase [Patescibacteria group bacterium]